MITIRAPYTLSFFGEGTDDPAWYRRHGGCALSAAITRYCYVQCRLLPASDCPRLRLTDCSEGASDCERQRQTVEAARRYLRIAREAEAACHADAFFAGAAEGRTAAEVALFHALHAAQGRQPGRRRLAAESMDFALQSARGPLHAAGSVMAAYGGLARVQFHPNDAFRVTPVPIAPQRVRDLEAHLLLFAPPVQDCDGAGLGRGGNNFGRRGQMLQLTGFAEEAVSILESGQPLEAFGNLMAEAWRVGHAACPHAYSSTMQTLYAEARSAGAQGAKIAGGGRLLLLFAPPDAHAAIRQRLRGIPHVPFAFDPQGSRIVSTPPDADERTEPSLLSAHFNGRMENAAWLYARAA